MEISTSPPDTSDIHFVTLSAPGTFIGAAVSAIVFTTLTTTGELAAAATSSGIELTGNVLAYGTEIVAGSLAANTVKTLAKTYSAVAKPAISNTTRLGALGISFLAGAGAAVATSAAIYGGKQVGSYLYSCVEEYKQKVATKIQYPIESSTQILAIENEVQLIENEGV